MTRRRARRAPAEAEYRAILLGLSLAAAHKADPLEVRCDSRLAIAAVRGADPVDPDLAALVAAIRTAAAGRDVRWRWHPRHENEAADALVRALLWLGAAGPATRASTRSSSAAAERAGRPR